MKYMNLLVTGLLATACFAQTPPVGTPPAGRGGSTRLTPRAPNAPVNPGNNDRPGCCDYKERPPLVFREDWKEDAAVSGITQAIVSNPNLILGLYGPGGKDLRKSHHSFPPDDPFYVWGGPATAKWALTLKHKDLMINMTTVSKIRWRTMETGVRVLHVILKLADGSWLISDEGEHPTLDWRETEMNFPNLHWRKLDITNVIEAESIEKPDLSKVDEVGFTDLMFGGYAYSSSRVDWIEVYGYPVKRDTAVGK